MKVELSMLNPTLDVKIPEPVESVARGKEFVSWGVDNHYPAYLQSLTSEVATLQSIINATVDYIAGDSIKLNVRLGNLPEGIVNSKGETIEGLIKKVALDKMTFGGYAIQVVRTLDGSGVAELYYKDFSKIRISEDQTKAYIPSKDWGYNTRAFVLPMLNTEEPISILYEKGELTKTVYPRPFFAAGIKAAEAERKIDSYHLSNISNNFSGNVIINLNNGQPDDEQKEEIERGFREKFSGAENAGRMLISYNDSKDNAVTVEKLEDDNCDKKYEELTRRCKETLFTCAGMNPVLLGVLPEHNGFSNIEYAAAFQLYNKTRVQPLQREIVRSLERILGDNCVTIEPYKCDESISSKPE